MTSLAITVLCNIGALALGVCAWAFGCFAIAGKSPASVHGFSVASFGLCALSLLLQLFEVGNRAGVGDFSAIADTIRGVGIASCTLVGVTILLNAVAFVRAKGDRRKATGGEAGGCKAGRGTE